jgi:hypothetical protein
MLESAPTPCCTELQSVAGQGDAFRMDRVVHETTSAAATDARISTDTVLHRSRSKSAMDKAMPVHGSKVVCVLKQVQ